MLVETRPSRSDRRSPLPNSYPGLCSDSSYSVVSRREADFVCRAKVSGEHGRLYVIRRVRRWSQLRDLNLKPAVYEIAGQCRAPTHSLSLGPDSDIPADHTRFTKILSAIPA